MGRMPVPTRHKALAHWGCPLWAAWRIARRFHRLSAASGWVAYALRTRPPLSCPRRGNPVRLACIRPAASVHPEPGSNSSLYYCFFKLTSVSWAPLSTYLLRFLIRQPVRPRGSPAVCLVLASSSQRSFAKPLFIFALPFRVLRVQKYSFFHYWQHFFSFIFQKFVILLIHSEKNFNIERKSI